MKYSDKNKQDDFVFHKKWMLYAPKELKKLVAKGVSDYDAAYTMNQVYMKERDDAVRKHQKRVGGMPRCPWSHPDRCPGTG